jgi:hydrogenase nickel incorporation protein HypB
VAVVTKLDLACAAGFDLGTLARNINGVRPGMKMLKTPVRTGEGSKI